MKYPPLSTTSGREFESRIQLQKSAETPDLMDVSALFVFKEYGPKSGADTVILTFAPVFYDDNQVKAATDKPISPNTDENFAFFRFQQKIVVMLDTGQASFHFAIRTLCDKRTQSFQPTILTIENWEYPYRLAG
ncbi:MAG: hypothetical protein GXW99_04890 [Clostridiales bacterium]|nr:hypothetical protein [Clostridiales bacterium]